MVMAQGLTNISLRGDLDENATRSELIAEVNQLRHTLEHTVHFLLAQPPPPPSLPPPPAPPPSPTLVTWHCPSMDPQATASLPAFATYAIGRGLQHAADMFVFLQNDSDVGDGYVVTDLSDWPPGMDSKRKQFATNKTAAAPSFFSGALSSRRCYRALSMPWPDTPFRPEHYSHKFTILKIDLLNHLPASLNRVVLIDGDTFSMPKSGKSFAEQLDLLQGEEVMAVGLSGVRLLVNGKLTIPPGYRSLNGGVMAFELSKFRKFARSFCAGRPWWACLAETMPRERRTPASPKVLRPAAPLADQSVWEALHNTAPRIFRWFPCGFHSETQVLFGVVNLLAHHNVPMPFSFCSGRPSESSCYPRGSLPLTLGRNEGDGCLASTGSATPLPANASLVVAITHGAAGQFYFARAVAAALVPYGGNVTAAIEESERKRSHSAKAMLEWLLHDSGTTVESALERANGSLRSAIHSARTTHSSRKRAERSNGTIKSATELLNPAVNTTRPPHSSRKRAERSNGTIKSATELLNPAVNTTRPPKPIEYAPPESSRLLRSISARWIQCHSSPDHSCATPSTPGPRQIPVRHVVPLAVHTPVPGSLPPNAFQSNGMPTILVNISHRDHHRRTGQSTSKANEWNQLVAPPSEWSMLPCVSYNHIAPRESNFRCYDSRYANHFCASQNLSHGDVSESGHVGLSNPMALAPALVILIMTMDSRHQMVEHLTWLRHVPREVSVDLATTDCLQAGDTCEAPIHRAEAKRGASFAHIWRAGTSLRHYAALPRRQTEIFQLLNDAYPIGGDREFFMIVEDDTFVRIEKLLHMIAGIPAVAPGTPFALGTVSYEDALYDPSGMANNVKVSAARNSSRFLPYPEGMQVATCCCNFRSDRDYFSGCYPDGGAGFGVNRAGLVALSSASRHPASPHLNSHYSDVAAGKLLQYARVPLIHCGSLFQLTPRFMQNPSTVGVGVAAQLEAVHNAYSRAISFHHVSEQSTLHWMFYEQAVHDAPRTFTGLAARSSNHLPAPGPSPSKRPTSPKAAHAHVAANKMQVTSPRRSSDLGKAAHRPSSTAG